MTTCVYTTSARSVDYFGASKPAFPDTFLERTAFAGAFVVTPFSPLAQQAVAPIYISTVTPSSIPSQTPVEQAQQALIETLQGYMSLADDWDGYGGKAADPAAVLDAVHFIRRLPSALPLPRPMLAGSGVVGLFWERGNYYASIDFDGTGAYCYIADTPSSQAGDDAVPVGQSIPGNLLEVIHEIGGDV